MSLASSHAPANYNKSSSRVSYGFLVASMAFLPSDLSFWNLVSPVVAISIWYIQTFSKLPWDIKLFSFSNNKKKHSQRLPEYWSPMLFICQNHAFTSWGWYLKSHNFQCFCTPPKFNIPSEPMVASWKTSLPFQNWGPGKVTFQGANFLLNFWEGLDQVTRRCRRHRHGHGHWRRLLRRGNVSGRHNKQLQAKLGQGITSKKQAIFPGKKPNASNMIQSKNSEINWQLVGKWMSEKIIWKCVAHYLLKASKNIQPSEPCHFTSGFGTTQNDCLESNFKKNGSTKVT